VTAKAEVAQAPVPAGGARPPAGAAPLVSIVIPHYNGREILLRCLAALAQDGYRPVEIIVVDNASMDGSGDEAAQIHPAVQLIKSPRNLGFAGGCNLGMRTARGKYFVLLNNDAVVTPGWLGRLVELAEQDERIAALQPKVLSLDRPSHFDYAAAAGGLMDLLGFPFARGRIFYTCEEDLGQYDEVCEIFWASGTCALLRRSALERVGDLDESFFAHMEEIDLDWRLHLAGFRVVYCPEATVYHNAGTTLPPEHPHKIFLNHRNGLVMVLKNYSASTLLWVLPARLMLELVAAGYFLLRGDLHQTRGILLALWATGARQPRAIIAGRRRAQAVRTRTDRAVMRRMYRGSVVWEYFVRRRRTCGELLR
jgi:GT2 family glycosyltransferase